MKSNKKKKPYYVNNAEFSQAVVDYVNSTKGINDPDSMPIVSDYISDCFWRIANGLSHRPNFIGYSYREELVMDAVENCLRAIRNYNIEAATRTGKPNAFSYFTTISWYAFLRRIAKEKKQQEIKHKLRTQGGIGDGLVHLDRPDQMHTSIIMNFTGSLNSRMENSGEKN